MIRQKDLVAEIEYLIEHECANQSVSARYITQILLGRHPHVTGTDADLALLCMREHISDTAEAAVRRRKPTTTERQQLLLPGYVYVQRRYTIERDGESVIVPVEHLTPSELRQKAKEQRKMGAGCQAHAEELDRLADERESQA